MSSPTPTSELLSLPVEDVPSVSAMCKTRILERVLEPVRLITEVTGTRPPAFAWLFGTPFDPSSVAGRAVLDAGIRYAVSNTAYQRIAD